MKTRRDILGQSLAAGILALTPRHALGTTRLPVPEERIGIEMSRLAVPGVSWALFSDSSIRGTGALGVKSADTREPVGPSTRFQAASLSKTINALCVLTLVRDAVLDLDEPVNGHLAGWQLGGHRNAGNVTTRMLLSHSGGVNVPGFRGYERSRSLPNVTEILDGVGPANSAKIRVQYDPGTRFAYSGGGVTVLQKLVADMTGLPYALAVERRVLKPLGMLSSSLVQPPQEIDLALGHDSQGKPVEGGYNLYPEQAAAGLWTTAADMARVICAVLRSLDDEADALLPSRLAKQMISPVIEKAGLGMFVSKAGSIGHVGVNLGYAAVFAAAPSLRRGYVVMSNGQNSEGLNDAVARLLIGSAGWDRID